ncbi:MAG: CehA/McbA family metallohydrolase, partial [Planctomycetaceae bacterium]
WIVLLYLIIHTDRESHAGEARTLEDCKHHLRIDGPREWSSFPETPEADRLDVTFTARRNDAEWTLRLRQQDVKQGWTVRIGDRELGRLVRDENDMVVYFAVPAGALADGENTLRIEQQARGRASPDDVRVGEIMLEDRPVRDVLSAATVEISVLDADSNEPLPARITIVDADGALHTPGAESNGHLAVRPGIIYTSTGEAQFGLPAGRYTIYAGRGFEYSLDSATITLSAGETVTKTLSLRREVSTPGYVACDTHVHTLTHSGHGDATVEERMITIAAEGIELPIAADHNRHVDHEPFARAMGVRRHFTPVIGNEVTTPVGHFNIFPVEAGAAVPDHTAKDWPTIFASIHRTPGVKVVILNHARDLHSGVRPFGPAWHNAVVGENLKGWALRANAMEIINSGATQTDPMRLVHDWMAMLNRGRFLTPVGASDSHDVARHFVGQGRTYIRCDDRDPGHIDVEQAVSNFLQGRVMVSYG